MKKVLLLLLFIFASAVSAGEDVTKTFKAINERLGYMEDVALHKTKKHLPIEDVGRERIVLSEAKKDAGKHGLDPESVTDFFIAQISAAKAIQYRCRADWLANPGALAREPRDLKTEVRPALLRLGEEILVSIKKQLESGKEFGDEQRSQFMAEVQVKHLSQRDKEVLFDALKAIRLKRPYSSF